MSSLNAQQRQAVVLRFGLDGGHEGERTAAEVGKAMGLPEAKARQLVSDAVKALDVKVDEDAPAQVRAALHAYDQR